MIQPLSYTEEVETASPDELQLIRTGMDFISQRIEDTFKDVSSAVSGSGEVASVGESISIRFERSLSLPSTSVIRSRHNSDPSNRKPAIKQNSYPVRNQKQQIERSTESPNNVESDEVTDEFDKLIQQLETSEVKKDYEPLPEEVQLAIDRICQKQRVKDAVWYQSSANWKKVIIMGVGVKKVQQNLNSCAEKFPDFIFETRENGPLHTKQYGNSILSIEEKSVSEENGITWEPSSYATCGLILQGEQLNKDNPPRQYSTSGGLYAVTSAHLSLTTPQCKEILSHPNPVPIEEMRRKIESHTTQRRYVLKLRNDNNNFKLFDLNHPAMFCYRHYYYKTDQLKCGAGKCELQKETDICHHHFMNDIALLPIEHHVVEQLQNEVKEEVHKYCGLSFEAIMPVTPKRARLMVENRTKVFVGFKSFCMRPSGSSAVRSVRSRLYAYHMAFEADSSSSNQSQPLVDGDSGSIVYVKLRDKKWAIGIFIGTYNDDTTDDTIYQAVWLDQALKDNIVNDYPHHLKDLRPFDIQALGL